MSSLPVSTAYTLVEKAHAAAAAPNLARAEKRHLRAHTMQPTAQQGDAMRRMHMQQVDLSCSMYVCMYVCVSMYVCMYA